MAKISSQEEAINNLLRQAKEEEAAARLAAQQAAKEAAAKKAAQKAAEEATKKKQNSYTSTSTNNSTSGNAGASKDTTADTVIDTSQGKYLGRFKLTAYCSCPKCCGKWSGGGTASGVMPTAGRTIAMAGVPFGTKLSINGHIYTVEDRGTAYGHVDVFMGSHSEALQFGLKYADVYQVG